MRRSLPHEKFWLRPVSPSLGSVFSRQLSAPAGSRSRNAVTSYDVRSARAFTLIELMVVVAIVAILAGLALSTLGYVNRKGAFSRAQAEVATLAAAIESYKLEFGAYPASASTLYADLTGSGTLNTNKVFFEPPPGMVGTNGSQKTFVDPYGAAYVYTTNATRNVGFFDLYSRPPDAKSDADLIHN